MIRYGISETIGGVPVRMTAYELRNLLEQRAMRFAGGEPTAEDIRSMNRSESIEFANAAGVPGRISQSTTASKIHNRIISHLEL